MSEVTVEQVEAAEASLKPCPFCGCRVGIGVCDEEGNYQGLEYLDCHYSGLSFVVTHDQNKDCILHTRSEELEHVGISLFDTLEEIVTAWNKRMGLEVK